VVDRRSVSSERLVREILRSASLSIGRVLEQYLHLPTGADADRSRRHLEGVVVRLAIGLLANARARPEDQLPSGAS